MSVMHKNRTWVCLGMCGIATALILFLVVRLFLCHLDETRAFTQISLLHEIQAAAHASNTPTGLCKGIRDALLLSPRAGDGRSTPSERSVEAVRQQVVSDLIRRLKQITAKDFGPDPQRWIQEFTA
jgi:hypothetical protein